MALYKPTSFLPFTFTEVKCMLRTIRSRLPVHAVGDVMMTGLVDFNQTDGVDAPVSAVGLRTQLRSYVSNVYRYNSKYIYDVVLYQYQHDQLPADHYHFMNILMEILGDAQQVEAAEYVNVNQYTQVLRGVGRLV